LRVEIEGASKRLLDFHVSIFRDGFWKLLAGKLCPYESFEERGNEWD
jgi:hypothetical protein